MVVSLAMLFVLGGSQSQVAPIVLNDGQANVVLFVIAFYFLFCLWWKVRAKKAWEAAMIVSAAVSGIFFGLADGSLFYLGGVLTAILAFFGLLTMTFHAESFSHHFVWIVLTTFTFNVCFVAMRFFSPISALGGSMAFFGGYLVLLKVGIWQLKRQEKQLDLTRRNR